LWPCDTVYDPAFCIWMLGGIAHSQSHLMMGD